VAIFLDNARSPGGGEGPDAVVERPISLAASLAVHRAARGQGVDLAVRGATGPSVEPGGSPERLLRFLGLLEYEDATAPRPFGRLPRGEAVLVAHADRTAGFEGRVVAVAAGEGAG
jgi:uncharacterized protein (DUF58 family)